MAEWEETQVSEFLKERVGRHKPNDPIVKKLKRLDKIDFSGGMHFSDKSSKTDMIIAKKGDLVISGINVAKGALAVYDGIGDIAATIHYSSYQFDDNKINVEYFKRFLKSPKFIQLLKDQVKGGIKTEIKPKHLLPLKIDLPDLETQYTIVSFFQRTENEIGDVSGQITYQQSLLKQLRQTILQEAMEGKLTANWRKQNTDLISGENHAARLLEQIKTEKEQLLQEGKIKKQKPLPPISEDEKPFDIPEGWIWCRLGNLIKDLPRNGISPKGVPYVTRIRSLKLSATTYGIFNPNEFKYLDDNVKYDPFYWLKNGDILIQRSNSHEYVGVNVIYNGKDNEFVYPDLMMKIRALNALNNNFLHRALSSPCARNYFRKNAKGSQQSMPKINQKTVVLTPIPIPPFSEQQAIIEKVDRLMAKIDSLEEQVKSRKEQAGQLMQAVLREAFNGG
ncbi:MAG: restriction endonuclease subunit S [Pseudomonadota bacterium]